MGAFLHTVKVAHYKKTATFATKIMPTPKTVLIPMLQHIGRACTPVVKVGDAVLKGQLIGDSNEFMSAPIHASTSGKVVAVRDIMMASGVYAPAVEIASDGLDAPIEAKPIEVNTLPELVAAVRSLGIVGLGGAGFPTSIKLNPKNIDAIDTLIVNATECEPFITADHREILEDPDDIVEGIELLKKLMGLSRAIIGIEENKPDAIKLMRKKAEGRFEVESLKSTYPQGAEKVIIYHCTGRRVMEGQLPADVGVVVLNVATLGNIVRGLKTGMPLTHKRITVSGDCVKEPANVYAPIGTSIDELVEFCGGYTKTPTKLIAGGPMMGKSLSNGKHPIIKSNNAVLAISDYLSFSPDPSPCIRCGRCLRACPLSLMPTVFEHAYEEGDFDLLEKQKVSICMECGCCAYVCPAKRPLVQINKLAKAALRNRKK
ncbi:MAG: electron transport complex subunit RsxC [Oscillospiraceae bacterium]|nr:electron transport complex subunit RsxC [Oscillospiraceae bacterium]